jgi:hypothetical protein
MLVSFGGLHAARSNGQSELVKSYRLIEALLMVCWCVSRLHRRWHESQAVAIRRRLCVKPRLVASWVGPGGVGVDRVVVKV